LAGEAGGELVRNLLNPARGDRHRAVGEHPDVKLERAAGGAEAAVEEEASEEGLEEAAHHLVGEAVALGERLACGDLVPSPEGAELVAADGLAQPQDAELVGERSDRRARRRGGSRGG